MIAKILIFVSTMTISLFASAQDSKETQAQLDKETRLLLFEAGIAVPSGAKEPEAAVSAIQSEDAQPRYHRLSPAMAMKMRNPASFAYPDGITGPHSDLFRKIRARYATEKLISPAKTHAPEMSH